MYNNIWRIITLVVEDKKNISKHGKMILPNQSERKHSFDKELSIMNDFECDFDHNQHDNHPFQSDVMFVTQMMWQ